MDNASKAILIAGAILIAVGLMSLLLMFFQLFKEYNGTKERAKYNQEIVDFNKPFEQYFYDVDRNNPGIQIYGYDVYNMVMKDFDLAQKNDEYVVQLNIKGSPPFTPNNSDLAYVKFQLKKNFGLSYDDLLINPSLDDATRQAILTTALNNFQKICTIDSVEYDYEGRIYRIIIREGV